MIEPTSDDLPEPDEVDELRARLERAEAAIMRLEEGQTVLPSVLGGIDPFLTPLPPDAGEAIGQLYNMLLLLHADFVIYKNASKKANAKLDFDAYQQRIAISAGHKHKLPDIDGDEGALHLQRIVAKMIALQFTATADPDDIGALSDRLIMRVTENLGQG